MTSIAFFELLGDELRPCDDRGPSYLLPSAVPLQPIPPPLSSQCTKRQIRRLARRGRQGRRGALNYKGIDKRYALQKPTFIRLPPAIEMIGHPYQGEIEYGPYYHPNSIKDRLIVVIYAQKGTDVPQEIADQALDMLRVRIIKGQRAMDEMIRVAEERKR